MTPCQLIDRLDAALPQTQCTRCGYPSCRAYAQAIAEGSAAINQCPPGGIEGVSRLAAITGRPAEPLNPLNGAEGPRAVAIIDENWCIGCTLCLDACPTDAILGGNKMMHTVIEMYCTGCELCLPVCPVDCISLENASGTRSGWSAWSAEQATVARDRYQIHDTRPRQTKGQGPEMLENQVAVLAPDVPVDEDKESKAASQKRAVIEAAMARARAARQPKT
ncbi:MAG: electron transport complex subunit RsxB [Polaromonas sp.]|nr:electron transport complex subunit RsxB [Polaromonas sp.]